MTRKTKTPRQRAEETLGVAERRVARLRKQRDQLIADRETLDAELMDAEERRDYAAQDPALPDAKPVPKPAVKAVS